MEFLSLLLITVLILSALFTVYKTPWPIRPSLISHKLSYNHDDINEAKKVPEPPSAWPIIGHLHLLGGQTPAFRTLGAIADKLGPVFAIRLGNRKAVVVSSWELVKECFTANDQAFLTRPRNSASVCLGYGTAFLGLCPYGPYWCRVRRVMTLEILSHRKLDLLADVRASELGHCIKDLYSENEAKVDMSTWFSRVAMSTLVRMVSGKQRGVVEDEECNYLESLRIRKAIKDFMYLNGVFVASDFVPIPKWLDFQGYLRSMKRNAAELDEVMSRWLEEHRQRRTEGVKEERDFIDTMLLLFKDDVPVHGHKSETVIKATTLNLIAAGVDTISLTLTWALSLLLNHFPVLKLAQEELDFHVGRERWVQESDIKNLTYLQAIIKETLRLYPPGPLAVPREAMEDCSESGYHVPKGAILIVNIWKLHRDPRVWPEPNEFRPERFLAEQAHVDVRGQQHEYIPFGSGRRACPGISLAMRVMSLTLGRVLQGFHVATPGNEPVDMAEGLGITMPKATTLEVMLSARLRDELYLSCD